ncbi:LysR family transcriptional regulator [Kaistia dalseonensis]|uniref:DNA-binding transcriptional LysR family regulator n=1 Tax=Kaistia dalseonensis TaxID=410840 RepID=A0ABU0HAY5_9HYPH|nr:LysR family transcriptional regulator [Kaistia dalseonensis]MCX5496852.1 LysR family transcriptional regulator [Kaistia dalseonensis]MDQ0439478.1 DNA-binding transcriptional LysR family regulator [Kaistia dalseonensis]
MDTLTRMRTFVEVVEAGGFSAAARKMGRSKALISKYVRELEDELGARLLNRTTRTLSLTEVGSSYARDATEILQRIEDLQSSVGDAHAAARGRLKISAPRTFGDGELGRAIMDFVVSEPGITIDLHLEDRFVDVVDEGFDVAIRISAMNDSSLIARRLESFRIMICATPDVIERYGMPAEPHDMAGKPCIIDTNVAYRGNWPFMLDGERISVPVKGRVEVNSPNAGRQAALAGLGFMIVPFLVVRDDIASGRLVPVLEAFEPPAVGIYAVYPHRRHLSGKVRAFIDFLVKWFEEHRPPSGMC